jgi:uncharacterized integral membrane protein (TIGR00698 family)
LPSLFARPLPGIAAAASLACAAFWVSKLVKPWLILEPLVAGMLIGILLTACIGLQPALKPGLDLCTKWLLEASVVLLGFRLLFTDIAALGPAALGAVLILPPTLIAIAWFLGPLFGLSRRLSLLVGVGNGICGLSATATIARCIGADERETALATSGLGVLGAAAVLGFTAVAQHSGLSAEQYGAWAGLSLQAVPNALAAAYAHSETAGQVGTLMKMARVAMLAPIALVITLLVGQRRQAAEARSGGAAKSYRATVPAYIVLLVAATALHSSGWLPDALCKQLAQLSAILLVTAMCALGLGVDLRSLRRQAGPAFGFSALMFCLMCALAYSWARWAL